MGLLRIEVAGDHHEASIGGVARAVVGREVVVLDLIEEVAVADDRVAARVALEGGGKQEARGGVVGIVEAHVDFPTDDVFFLFEFRLRQDGKEDQAGEAFEKHRERVRGAIDVVHRAIETRVGIPMPAG